MLENVLKTNASNLQMNSGAWVFQLVIQYLY